MCTITGITSQQACEEGDGGIKATYIAEYATLGFTVASKKVSALTGALKKFVFHKDSTAFFNQVGERPSLRVHRYNQEAFMKFGDSDAAADAADDLKACCKLVAIHLLENGNVRFQGVQFTSSAKTALEVSAEEALATVSDMSDVSGAESRVEIRLLSKSKNVVVGNNSVLTEAYLDALIA